MSQVPNMASRRILQAYYAATIVFLLLDYGAGMNIRIAGLEAGSTTSIHFLVIPAQAGIQRHANKGCPAAGFPPARE